MNLQTLSIILIIIVLPITLILSAYTKIQIDTLALQTMYKTQLRNATYDAVVAFQLNTLNNDYSTVSDSMRRDISAVIQTFMNNMASNMGVGAAKEEAIKPFIPAIAFTLYDGYYIYSPSINHFTTNDGVEQTKYQHVLKPYIYYTARYVREGIDIVVNYSLDNYVVITGMVGDEYITKAGYLTANKLEVGEEVLERRLPVTTIVYTDKDNKSSVNDVGIYETEIANLYVSSDLMTTDRLSNGQYLTDTRLFVDPTQLSINVDAVDPNNIKLRENPAKINLTKEIIESKASLLNNRNYYIKNAGEEPTYPALKKDDNENNIAHNTGFYVEPSTDSYYIPANSAQQYYNTSQAFTEWVVEKLGHIKASDAVKADGSKYEEFGSENIFNISVQNDPEAEDSIFTDHRRDVIKASIQDNLSQAIASYNLNSEGMGTTSNFQMPILSEEEWDQVLKNVCLITFMQGIQVGTKMFNDYAIVTSTKNKEYVPEEAIYFVNTKDKYGKETRRWKLS